MRDAGRSAPERERREAERRLLSEEGLRNFIEQLPLTVYIDRLDESSSNVYTSPRSRRAWGTRPSSGARRRISSSASYIPTTARG